MNNSFLTKIFSALLIVMLALGASPVSPARAATIVVNTTTDEDTPAGTNCSLREAIIAANTDAAYNDCTAGAGADTITLTSGSTYALTLVGAGQGDLDVTSNIAITASGGTVAIIDPTTPAFNERVFDISAAGNLTLDTIRVTTASTASDGAAILNAGTLTIQDGSEITSNLSTGGGGGSNGGGVNSTGTLTITSSIFTSNSATNNGGAIYINGGTASITSSAFNTQNAAAIDDGAGIYLNAGTLTINGSGFANNDTSNGFGGAIYQNGGTLNVGTTTGNTFTSNDASNGGGAIYMAGGTATIGAAGITNSFSGNTSTNNGGAIHVAGGTLTINNASFTNSLAGSNSADNGGAIYHNAATLLTVTNSSFTGNTATNGDGGAIVMNNNNPGSSLTITGSTFTNNTSTDDGGAIANASEPTRISNSTFAGNSITSSTGNAAVGGAIRNEGTADDTRITLSTFTNNSVTHTTTNDDNALGGAIQNEGSGFVLANVTFSGNSASYTGGSNNNAQGGALYTQASTTIHNVTFSGNSVTETGTGLAQGGNIFNNGTTVTVGNTIVNSGTPDNCSGTITNGGNNIDSAATCGWAALLGSVSNTNPNLGTITGSPQYFPLNTGSPAINTGSNAICATATSTNNQSQNGLTRPQGVNCEIGSYEAPATITLTLQKTVVNNNGGTALDTAWTLSATGPTNISGVEGNAAVTNAIVSAGNYTLSESVVSGYSNSGVWSCSGFTSGSQTDDDTLTLGAGDNVTCVITNDDISPVLTLVKTTTNDNGGTALDTAWTLNAAGPTNISGVEGNAAVTNAAVNAGTYTLTESGGPSGYTQTGLSCSGAADLNPADGLAIAVGETVTCTFTNNDVAPTLTLAKTVTNDNGGTALDTAWTLNAAGPTNISGVEGNAAVTNAAVNAGTYTLTESGGPSGYTQTGLVCSGAADGNPADGLTLLPGETVTCTFTNNDVSPVLTLVKTAVNDSGGTALDTAWTLNAAGPTPISGVEGAVAVTSAAVNAGTYTLTESGGPAGYTQTGLSCSGAADANPADGLTLLPGETVTCTFTNNDVSPVLTLVKTVVNDNGGTAADTAWTLNAAGPTNISGVEGAVAVTNAAVNAGTYTLTESGGPSGYTQTGLVCSGAADGNPADGLTIALGETITCTFTNNDIAPTLTLVKTATNDNGGTALDTAWTLNAAGPTNISGIEGAVAVTGATVSAGNYTLTESGGPAGYTQTGITCSGSDANGADGLTLLPGETVTCTFANNDDAPGLTLLKTVVSDNGGTALDTAWTLNAAGPTPISGVEGAATVTGATVSAGNYTLTESGGPAGYAQTGLTCSGAADADPSDGLTIALGETVTCTFTNNDIAPTLTLVKTVVNDNGGLAGDTDWTLSTTGPTAISGIEGAAAVTNATVDAGNYTLGESGPANYTQTGIACSGSDANGADGLTLLPGETVTCTFTNNDVAAVLTLLKTVVNDNGGLAADTAWTLNAAGPTPISGVEGAVAVTNAAVNAGGYTLTESGGPSGYTQTSLVCSGAADANPNDGLTIALGETITCTFTNNDIAPTLTLVKDVTNNDGGTNVVGDWTLDASGPSAISGVTGAGAVTNAIVDAGSYSLSETAVAGYNQTAITCTGSDANGADGLDLDPGENVTCTFFNDDIGATLTLVKDVTNNNIGTAVDTDWTLTATGPSTISGIEGAVTVTGAGVSAGNYTLTESGPANYTQTAITCTGSDANGADGLTLALGEIVTCTFFNDDDVPVLLVPNVNSTPNTGDATIAENEVIVNSLNINQLIVQFNWDADNPAGTGGTDDVDNPNNYILLYSATGSFNTPSCAVVAAGGVVAPDIRIPVTSVNYSNGGGVGPFIATLNLSASLTNAGYYRLYVCGTTSIVLAADPTVTLAGNGVAAGTDFIRNFQITAPPAGGGGGFTTTTETGRLTVTALPATGFAPNRVTMLAEQPEDLAYANLGDLWIEIPALGVKSSIVGVPQTKDGEWDVTWLANNVGWLNGTAFPTWEGNSVVTAHVTNANGLDGPFANLKKLKFGDQIIVHAFGQKYIFELRNSRMIKPFSTSFAFEHLEDESYLTLITCQVYLPESDTYLYRRVIRAVLVSVENE